MATGWDVAPSLLALSCGDVHVWAFEVACSVEELSEFAGTLSGDERARASRFRFDRDRNRFIRVRGGLRKLLGGYLGERPSDVFFEYGTHGKPALGSRYENPLKFNVSHSGDLALMAIGRHVEVGIDVEAIRPMADATAIAARFFSPGEVAELRGLPAASFFTCWTRKEAYLKARGRGLTEDLQAFTVTISPGVTPAAVVHDGNGEGEGWLVHELPSLAGYSAALVTKGYPRLIRFHEGTPGITARLNQSPGHQLITRIS
jgi:4'-phosphopantetheinyl transferase